MTNEDITKELTRMRKNFDTNSVYGSYCIDCLDMAIEALKAQPEPCEYAVSAIEVEEMLRDLLPVLGMLEIEGDETKTAAVCETVHNALDGLWKLPFVKPDSKESSLTQKTLDSISRQAAIDAVKKHYRIDNDLLELIVYEIEQLPSAHSKQLQVLANVLDGCPLTQPCDRMWKQEGWCKEHCKAGQQEPDAECWLKYAEVMASEQ